MPAKSSSSRIKTLCQIALACYWVTLVAATHLPPTTHYLPSQRFDKLYHVAAFAIIAGLLATAWQLSAGALTARHLFWAWVAVVVYGALDELTQIPVGRECSIWDLSADALGAATGILVFVLLRKAITERSRESQS